MFVKILGSIISPEAPKLWDGRDASEWLAFMDIDGLSVDGDGIIDGRGRAWWDHSCRDHPHLVHTYI